MTAERVQAFFDTFFKPALANFWQDPTNEALAKLAADAANNVVERLYWLEYTKGTTTAPNPGDYRKALRARSLPFAIIHDVAEGYKHIHLNRGGRLVTTEDQTKATGGFDRSAFDNGFDVGRIVVDEDAGNRHEFDDIIVEMEKLLQAEITRLT